MRTLNEAITQNKIIQSLTEQTKQHQQLNEATERRYAALSYFDREEIACWLQKNLSAIPILAKTKKNGLRELLAGHTESNAALLLLRQAMQALQL